MPDQNQNNGFMQNIMSLLARLAQESKTVKTIDVNDQKINAEKLLNQKNLEMLSSLILNSLNKDFSQQKDVAMQVVKNPAFGISDMSPIPIGLVEKFVPNQWMENARNQAYSSQVAKYLFNGDEIPSNMTVPQDKLNEVRSVIGDKNTADALNRLSWQQKQYIDYGNKMPNAKPFEKMNEVVTGSANKSMNMLYYGVFEPNALGYWQGYMDEDAWGKMRAFADTLYNTSQRIK